MILFIFNIRRCTPLPPIYIYIYIHIKWSTLIYTHLRDLLLDIIYELSLSRTLVSVGMADLGQSPKATCIGNVVCLLVVVYEQDWTLNIINVQN